nr:acetyl-CoA C-acetyltransferase [Blastococcus saxobsidens]
MIRGARSPPSDGPGTGRGTTSRGFRTGEADSVAARPVPSGAGGVGPSRRTTVRDAVICEPLRTPVGGFGGSLRDVPVQELAATVIRALIERTGLPPESVDDVLLGHCYPTMDAPALGRVAALDAGLPVTASGLQIDRRCGSGLQAVVYAAMQVQSGASDVVLAGGAESMSNAPFYSTAMRWGVKPGPGVLLEDGLARGRVTAGGQNHPVPGGMLETAENLRREYGIGRAEQDEYAVRSHQRAAAAAAEGRFADEIVPVTVKHRKGETVVDRDEHIRPDSSVETLAKLRPILGKNDPDATVTAGNASGQNDGAAVAIVTHPEKAAELGLRPLARLVSFGIGGVPPKTMGIGPVPATARALALADVKLSDVDLIELNEAFASQVLAVAKEWGFTDSDWERTNVNGSGISLGHPVGATGGRILATLLREMDRRDARYGLETMCIGGGQGLAALFERV